MRFDPIESFADMRHEFGEHGGVNLSVETSTTFTVMHAETMPEIFRGGKGPEGGCYLYGRHFNPTVYVLGKQLAALEGAEAGYATASGMSAIAATILQLCDHGDSVVSASAVYGGTYALFHDYLPKKCGITVDFVDPFDLGAVEAAFTNRTRVLYIESMSNPTLRVPPIDQLAKLAHVYGIKLVVDNTFTPLIMTPIEHGADVVIHSATKFINGASDVIAGVVCGTTEFVQSLMDLHEGSLMLLGPTMDPRLAFEISMRLPHLGLRVTEHSRRAQIFAERLNDLGVDVVYPGLKDHPDHEQLAQLGHPQFGYGGLFGIDLGPKGDPAKFMEYLQNQDRFGFMAVSLGYFETLMSHSASSTSSEMTEEDKDKAGISPGYVRFSIGYTGSVEQRWRQMMDALRACGILEPENV